MMLSDVISFRMAIAGFWSSSRLWQECALR